MKSGRVYVSVSFVTTFRMVGRVQWRITLDNGVVEGVQAYFLLPPLALWLHLGRTLGIVYIPRTNIPPFDCVFSAG